MADAGGEIRSGVKEAFDYWLSQHEADIPGLLRDAFRETCREWLNDHAQEVLDAVSVGASRR